MHSQDCCGELLRIKPLQTSGSLQLVLEEKYTETQLTAVELCFYGLEAKCLIYTSEIQESFCQSKLCEVATMLYNCTKKKKGNKSKLMSQILNT